MLFNTHQGALGSRLTFVDPMMINNSRPDRISIIAFPSLLRTCHDRRPSSTAMIEYDHPSCAARCHSLLLLLSSRVGAFAHEVNVDQPRVQPECCERAEHYRSRAKPICLFVRYEQDPLP